MDAVAEWRVGMLRHQCRPFAGLALAWDLRLGRVAGALAVLFRLDRAVLRMHCLMGALECLALVVLTLAAESAPDGFIGHRVTSCCSIACLTFAATSGPSGTRNTSTEAASVCLAAQRNSRYVRPNPRRQHNQDSRAVSSTHRQGVSTIRSEPGSVRPS